MKQTTTAIRVFVCLLIQILAISCVNQNVLKLKNIVDSIDAACPVPIGSAGRFESIRYNEEENKIFIKISTTDEFAYQFLDDRNKENIRNNLKMLFLDNSNQDLCKAIVNAGAALNVTYTLPSTGQSVIFELSSSELNELKDSKLTDQDRQIAIIRNKLATENNRLPMELDQGLTMTKVSYENDNIIFNIEVDETLYDIKLITSSESEIKKSIISEFTQSQNDLAVQNELKLLTSSGVGYIYRYYGNKSHKGIDIVFSPKELQKLMR